MKLSKDPNNKTYLDVSARYDTQRKAVKAGERTKQLEGFDVKDIIPFVDDVDLAYKSFLTKKYHRKWARKNEIDTFIDDVVESAIDWINNASSVEELNDEEISGYHLGNNYPNPFNPTTSIKYQIPQLSFVTLKVYDVLGNEIITLVNEQKPAGEYNVKFRIDNLELTSGIYFYQLLVGNSSTGTEQSYIETKKMILLK